MIRKRDTIEVYRCTAAGKPASGKKATAFRFRMLKSGEDEAMYHSETVFETADRALDVAGKFNEQMYCGDYTVVLVGT